MTLFVLCLGVRGLLLSPPFLVMSLGCKYGYCNLPEVSTQTGKKYHVNWRGGQ